MDLAHLGIKIDYADIDKAVNKLKELEKVSSTVERQTKDISFTPKSNTELNKLNAELKALNKQAQILGETSSVSAREVDRLAAKLKYLEKQASLKGLSQGNRELQTLIKQTGQSIDSLTGKIKTSDNVIKTWWKRFGEVGVGFTLIYQTVNLVTGAIHSLNQVILDGIKQSGELAATQAKLAMWISFATENSIKFAEAMQYAGQQTRMLSDIALTSMSTLSELSSALDELGQAQVILSPQDMKNFADLVDFTKLVAQTTGSTTKQIRQELQALMQGEMRTTNILIRTAKSLNILTEQDIQNLKLMQDRYEILTKLSAKISEYMKQTKEYILSADVGTIFEKWEKALERLISKSVQLTSYKTGTTNIFGETLYKHFDNLVKKINELTGNEYSGGLILLNNLFDKFLTLAENSTIGVLNLFNAISKLEKPLGIIGKALAGIAGDLVSIAGTITGDLLNGINKLSSSLGEDKASDFLKYAAEIALARHFLKGEGTLATILAVLGFNVGKKILEAPSGKRFGGIGWEQDWISSGETVPAPPSKGSWELMMEGMAAAKVRAFQILQDMTSSIKKITEDPELDKLAQKVTESLMTPIEKLIEEKTKLDKLVEAGKITHEQELEYLAKEAKSYFNLKSPIEDITIALSGNTDEWQKNLTALKESEELIKQGQKNYEEFQKSIQEYADSLEKQADPLEEFREGYSKLYDAAHAADLSNQAFAVGLLNLSKNIIDTKDKEDLLREAFALYADELKNLPADEVIRKIKEIASSFDTHKSLWDKGIDKYLDSVKDLSESITDIIAGMFDNLEDMLVDFITTGEASFEQLVSSIQSQIARMFVQQYVTAPLAQSMHGMFGSPAGTTTSTGSAGGALSSLTSGFGLFDYTLPGTGVPLATEVAAASPAAAESALATGRMVGGVTIGQALGMGSLGGLGYSTIGSAVGLPQNQYTGITSTLGGALGYWGGSAAGTALGGTLGSIVPVAGTAIGAAAGGLLGGAFSSTPDDADLHIYFGDPYAIPEMPDYPVDEYVYYTPDMQWVGGEFQPEYYQWDRAVGNTVAVNIRKGDSMSDAQAQEIENAIAGYFDSLFNNIENIFGISVEEAIGNQAIGFHEDDYSGDINATIQKYTDTFFQYFTDELASSILEVDDFIDYDTLKQFQLAGESISDTFIRVMSNLQTIPDAVDRINTTMEESGVDIVTAYNDLVDQWNYIQQLMTNTFTNVDFTLDWDAFSSQIVGNFRWQFVNGLYQVFIQGLNEQMSAALLDNFNADLESLWDGFWEGDVSIESLTSALDIVNNVLDENQDKWNEMIDIFDELGVTLDDTASELDELTNEVDQARNDYINALQAEIDSLNEIYNNYEQARDTYASALQTEINTLEQQQEELENAFQEATQTYINALQTEINSLSQAQQELETAYEQAKSTYISVLQDEINSLQQQQEILESNYEQAKQNYLNALQDEINIKSEAIQEAENLAATFENLTEAIKETRTNLIVGSANIPSSYSYVQAQLNNLMSDINSDDMQRVQSALEQLPDLTSTFLDLSKQYSSYEEYLSDYYATISMLNKAESTGISQQSIQEQQIGLLTQSKNELQNIYNEISGTSGMTLAEAEQAYYNAQLALEQSSYNDQIAYYQSILDSLNEQISLAEAEQDYYDAQLALSQSTYNDQIEYYQSILNELQGTLPSIDEASQSYYDAKLALDESHYDDQITYYQSILDSLTEQISLAEAEQDYYNAKLALDESHYDDQITYYQSILNVLNDINNSTLDVSQAQQNYIDTLQNAVNSGASQYSSELATTTVITSPSPGYEPDVLDTLKDYVNTIQKTEDGYNIRIGSVGFTVKNRDDLKEQLNTNLLNSGLDFWDYLTNTPTFAAGGTVYKPTLAVVGEAGIEHITPDSQMKDVKEKLGEIKEILWMMLNTTGDNKKVLIKLNKLITEWDYEGLPATRK